MAEILIYLDFLGFDDCRGALDKDWHAGLRNVLEIAVETVLKQQVLTGTVLLDLGTPRTFLRTKKKNVPYRTYVLFCVLFRICQAMSHLLYCTGVS